MSPIVSVVMPVYNDGIYLNEAINSLREQTFQNWELIIVNDGSDDQETLKILNNIHDKKIEVINTVNKGPAIARNLGIKKSNGKYILPLDADDLIKSTYMEKAVSIMEMNANIGIVYCEAELFGERNGKWDLPEYSLPEMLHNNIIFVTAFFRKMDWNIVGGYDERFKYGIEDYDFWLSILELNRTVYKIPEILFKYRIKKESRSTRFEKDKDIVLETYKQIVGKHKSLYANNLEEVIDIFRRREIDILNNMSRIKNLVPGIRFLSKNTAIKKKIKKILNLK